MSAPTIVVIDNYDSFVYNLVQYLQQLGAECEVHRNDAITVDEVAARHPDGVLISPGPGVPAEAGISEALIEWAAETGTPLLGVCLGHQAIAEVYGAVVDRAPELMHGRTSAVAHDSSGLFEGLPQPFAATRYHSLAVVDGTVPDALVVTARAVGDSGADSRPGSHGRVGADYRSGGDAPPGVTSHSGDNARSEGDAHIGRTMRPAGAGGALGAGPIMGLRHRSHPIVGVQFHPESVLTQGGHRLLASWLAMCGYDASRAVAPLEAAVEELRLTAV